MLLFSLALGVVLSRSVVQNVRENFAADRLISLSMYEISDSVTAILDRHEIDRFGHWRNEVHLKVSPQVKRELMQSGITLNDFTEEYINNMERSLQDGDFICLDGPDECASASIASFHSKYQKFDTIHSRFNKIAETSSSITKLQDFGTSYENRTSKILWIGNDLTSEEKPLIFYFCAIHAREWITPMFCTYMAEMLTDRSNPESQELISNFTFAIVPVANPDGYVYSFEVGNAWRKTRKPNSGNARCPGADANRNYEVGFGGPGASKDECSNTFHGAEPFDQPCTASIKNFVDKYQDRIVHINDIHSYGEYFLSPFAGSRQLPTDSNKHEQCSEAVVDAIKEESGLTFKTGSFARALYVASGVSNDYFYTVNGITHSYTYEARGGGKSGIAGFQPPVSNIMPSNTELYAGMVALVRCIYSQEVLKIPVPEIGTSSENPDERIPDEVIDSNEIEDGNVSGLVAVIGILAILVALLVAMLIVVHQRVKRLEIAADIPISTMESTRNPMARF